MLSVRSANGAGEDNVLWGTDFLFYGSPQDEIQALRTLTISNIFRNGSDIPSWFPGSTPGGV
jgi:hypothetical protein